MTNYMNNQIVWESRQEDMIPQVPEKITQVLQGCERDPNAPKSYQINVNLTTLTITFPGIETLPLYSIIVDPFVGIVCENSEREKRAMNVDELQKFSDAILKRVLSKISAINVEARYGFEDPHLSKEDKELMILFEEEILERLKYHRQMRR
ncbi:hypothetical protein Tco_0414551 [Tanacetum coccineum]